MLYLKQLPKSGSGTRVEEKGDISRPFLPRLHRVRSICAGRLLASTRIASPSDSGRRDSVGNILPLAISYIHISISRSPYMYDCTSNILFFPVQSDFRQAAIDSNLSAKYTLMCFPF